MSLAELMRRESVDLWGVAKAQTPRHYEAYRDWIAAGKHGEMAYLQDHLPLKAAPSALLEGARSVIVAALNYNQEPPTDPKIARYALGRDYHKVLRSKLNRIASDLSGGRHRICVDSAPLMERDFAQQAGIGWFGKNTMIINSRRGSWFVLGFILTTLDLEPSSPAEGGCGTCSKCIDACPTGAIVHENGRWQVDARQCISYLTIEHKGEFSERQAHMVGEWTFGCDVCQEVCPFNQPRVSQPDRAPQTTESDFLARRAFPPVSDLAAVSHAEWDRISRGSPLRRAGYEGLRRNARANLANRVSPPKDGPSESGEIN